LAFTELQKQFGGVMDFMFVASILKKNNANNMW